MPPLYKRRHIPFHDQVTIFHKREPQCLPAPFTGSMLWPPPWLEWKVKLLSKFAHCQVITTWLYRDNVCGTVYHRCGSKRKACMQSGANWSGRWDYPLQEYSVLAVNQMSCIPCMLASEAQSPGSAPAASNIAEANAARGGGTGEAQNSINRFLTAKHSTVSSTLAGAHHAPAQSLVRRSAAEPQSWRG